MTHADYGTVALTLWREARGEGTAGLTAVACVIRNRVKKNHSTPFAEVTKKWAFSSMTAPGDPNLVLYPADTDPQWQQAQLITGNVLDGLTADITGGSTLYYAPKSIKTSRTITLPDGTILPFPTGWNSAVVEYSCTIGSQVFFVEH
jgi:spore germination cell wall hydrolase CwlJ-like protein